MTQFGPEVDKYLNKLSRHIGLEKKKMDDATLEHERLWNEVFDTFEEFGRVGKQARFIADDGFYLAKQTRQGSPRLVEDLLLANLTPEQIDMITVPTVSPALLEEAIQRGDIDASVLEVCMITPDPTPVRKRDKWTSDDKRMATMMDIEINTEISVE